ncbi:MAG: Aminoglycoside N(6)-acetyltransferase type 1 [Armatimonadetes bacterium]|jgi:aminoglycoside 6'-N-acetyltransferase I|nr:Aminoglycoside N(6)-acetyltransferase type 1 [Armatimonadota bacterium]
MSIRIRRVVAEDRSEWLRMRLVLFGGHDEAEHLAEMDGFLTTPEDTPVFVVARADGKLGGFVEAGTRTYAEGCHSGVVGYIEGWYVDPDLRQQGVGRRLIEAVEEWARGRGLQEMASDCLLDNRTSELAHLALGYEEVERAIHFRKTL